MKKTLSMLTIGTVLLFVISPVRANQVVVVPLGGSTGDATVTDVVKGKTFSNKEGKGLAGKLDLKVGQIYTNSIDMQFRLIPAGSFIMGSPDGTGDTTHRPVWPEEPFRSGNELQHIVILTKPFYMQTTEVTQGQWQQIMGSNPSNFSECGQDCPVEQVSWFDAQNFIDALNAKEGRSLCNTIPNNCYSLPTEAQWEYAARAGTVTAFYSGDITFQICEVDPNLNSVSWYCGNSGVTYNGCYDWSGQGGPACAGTHPVAQKEPNNWGLYDMSGNVNEWCDDWYASYPDSPIKDPEGPMSGTQRILRGGGLLGGAVTSRLARRVTNDPSSKILSVGFRIALPTN